MSIAQGDLSASQNKLSDAMSNQVTRILLRVQDMWELDFPEHTPALRQMCAKK